MNRRDFMGLVLMYPALEIISDIAFAQSRTKKSYTNQLINNLVRELSEYDIVHFGEFHPTKNLKGPSTLEDFVDFLLPKFRDPNIVQRPYDSIRAENMVVEVFPDGSVFIPLDELKKFDQNGLITKNNTPILYEEILPDTMEHLDPRGTVRLAKEGVYLGYEVRGLMPPNKVMMDAIEKARPKSGNPSGSIRRVRTINIEDVQVATLVKSYLQMVRIDVKSGKRLILYGGTAHNDFNDEKEDGIADEMRSEFPGKYVSVDLIKPSIIKVKGDYYEECREIAKSNGINLNNLRKMHYLKITNYYTKNEPISLPDYLIFIPQRKFL